MQFQGTWPPERHLAYIVCQWPLLTMSVKMQIESIYWLKGFLHISHLNGHSPVWVRRCTFKAQDTLKDFLQISQLYGRSPEWMRRCDLKLLGRMEDFLHTSQANGFYHVWVRTCNFKVFDLWKGFLHISHATAAPHYECVDATSKYLTDWKISYIHHM